MDEGAALAQFVGNDIRAAERGFAVLARVSRPWLHGFLRQKGIAASEDREEVLQETFLYLWRKRESVQNIGVPAWRAYLKRAALWQAGTLFRDKQGRDHIRLDDGIGEMPDAAESTTDLIPTLASLLVTDEIENIADCVLLGLDAKLSPRTHGRRLLAAQLFYVDGEPWQRVLRLISSGTIEDSEPKLDRALLDDWLCDESVLRHLAYQTLYLSAASLCATLLARDPSAESVVTAGDIAEISGKARTHPHSPSGFGNFTYSESLIIIWRYRYGLSVEQVLMREDLPCSAEKATSFLDRLPNALPFTQIMQQLIRKVGATLGEPTARAIFARREIWQRLAFQYRYFEDLPHKEIQSRLQSAALLVGADVSLAQLNVWLSGGRLIARVGSALVPMHQNDTDD